MSEIRTAEADHTLRNVAASWATWIWTKPTKTAATQEIYNLLSVMIEQMSAAVHGKWKEQIAQLEADLQAARTAAELAQAHREASDKLIQEMSEYMRSQSLVEVNGLPHAELAPDWCEREQGLQRRAKELLSCDTLTPSKTEQLESLVKAYEHFVVQYFTTKDSKAEEARDMLIEQYNRVVGEVNHA